ncbi:D-alanine-D-alanine ligase [Jatrophihabitans endophyticus]|uniref:D-alanine-D-alanine ligase n=1 Tax=Jatrophihabitans endophyticus TaxID=1206085 RepID=A0A1M5U2L8_9ACTN|nr:D-alanine--D-alanine ligase [Jatrophihabitans endophyticus]SHH57355.1 D-alanine-D-alanine ligase [Jatrophihabitans endophyticus]
MPRPPRRVLHLAGSPTDDFFADLSLLYAADCLAAVADPARYDPLIAWVSPDGSWRFPASLDRGDIAAAAPYTLPAATARLADEGVEVVVPQLFCRAGMTTYRALIEAQGIPLVGNTGDVMALTANKAQAKQVVAGAGVRVAAGRVVDRGEDPAVALPAVVKPVDADNSAGVSLVRERVELRTALAAALAHSRQALVESYVELGREVRCGVVERDGELVVLPLEEYAVHPTRKPVRGADDKLARDGAGELGLVAKDAEHAWIVPPDDPVNAAVGAAARAAHRALGCRHYSLFDFRVDPTGTPVFLEASLYCSFARTSVLAVMAAAAGIPVERLFADLVTAATAGEGAPQ